MKKKTLLLILYFVAFYTLIHIVRHLPDLLHGELAWNGEKTYTLSLIRIGADMLVSLLFVMLPYLIFYRWYEGKKWFWISVALLLSLIVCFLLDFAWTNFMEQPIKVRLSIYLPQAVFFFTMYAVFGTAFYFIRYSQYKELKEADALVQNRQSELAFLRSQINPHFLFNNLNNIYSLVYHQSDQSLNAIAALSELLRYMLYDSSQNVLLSQEIAYIQKYIALQQLKYEHPEKISFEVDGHAKTILIPPLLFIPFVENAFKHGDANAKDWLTMKCLTTSTHVIFFCANKKAQKYNDPQGGIGIENVRRRLELLYSNKHQLEINEDQALFTVRLSLNHEN